MPRAQLPHQNESAANIRRTLMKNRNQTAARYPARKLGPAPNTPPATVGGTNMEKWGDHQEKKLFIDNTAQASPHSIQRGTSGSTKTVCAFRRKRFGVGRRKVFSLKCKNNK